MRRRTGSAIVFALLMALGLGAAPASAEPLSLTFTEGRANVGTQLSVANDDDALFTPPAVAPFAAQIDPATGAISAGVLGVPEFVTHIEDPVDADVAVEFEIGTIPGSFDQATGALALSGKAGGTLVSEGRECDVSTEPETLELTTAGNTGGVSPLFGAPFAVGLAGPGAIAGEWTDMHATALAPEDELFCEDVEGEIGGPGGIWLDQQGDVTPPPAPQLTGTDPGSPNASGAPRIRGAAEAGSTVRLYAGSGCTGSPVATASAAELASPGIRVEVAEGATATFSATATDAVGNASACSVSISYTRPKPEVKGEWSSPWPPRGPTCTVPKLTGKTLGAARAALKNADCKVGEVQRPKRRKGKGKGLGPLVVKSSQPGVGAKPADGVVDLRLGRKH